MDSYINFKKFRESKVFRDRELLHGEVVNSTNKVNNARTYQKKNKMHNKSCIITKRKWLFY